jgi:hypothetical protein
LQRRIDNAKAAEMWLTCPVPGCSAKCFNLAEHLLRSPFSRKKVQDARSISG